MLNFMFYLVPGGIKGQICTIVVWFSQRSMPPH